MSYLHNGIFHFLAKAEPCEKKEILKAFNAFDCDGTGKISLEDLKAVAEEVGEDITEEELQVCEVQTCSSCSAQGGRAVPYCEEDWLGACGFAGDTISVLLGPCLRPSFRFALCEHPASLIQPNLVSKLCCPTGDD